MLNIVLSIVVGKIFIYVFKCYHFKWYMFQSTSLEALDGLCFSNLKDWVYYYCLELEGAMTHSVFT